MQIAIITGAGSGIGRAVAMAMLNAGYGVVLAGRRSEPLDNVVREAGANGKNALPASTDVANAGSVRALFDKAVARFGRVDVLFNNAGISSGGAFDTISVEQWQRVVDINLTGSFLCAQQAFRVMKAQNPRGGRIINNGSISAHAPRPNSAPYTATKHAITGLTRSLSLDGRAFDIACGQIDIGNAATEMAQKMATGVPQADGSIAVEPLMDVAQVAGAVLYMAGLPLAANVQFMTVMATKMPYVGRG
jgi:NADP-dependent 3-hydroxy acid dehydrogenase YdfG